MSSVIESAWASLSPAAKKLFLERLKADATSPPTAPTTPSAGMEALAQLEDAIAYADRRNHSGIDREEAREILAALRSALGAAPQGEPVAWDRTQAHAKQAVAEAMDLAFRKGWEAAMNQRNTPEARLPSPAPSREAGET